MELPDYLPLVFPTQNGRAEIPERKGSAAVATGTGTHSDLSALLSQVLLSFTVDFERESTISLPISANTLRVLNESGVRVRELPHLTGVSKEANSMSAGFLERHGCVVVEADPSASRGKVVRLTSKGRKAQDKYRRTLGATEEHWVEEFGEDRVVQLLQSLERLVGEPNGQRSPLLEGLQPYPEGWRALVRRPDTLPHYPMVLHRGGYPDGS
jgi:DNA-binding MarR family transcriptional regulator